MIIGIMLSAIVSGLLASVTLVFMGQSLLLALAGYTVAGTLGVVCFLVAQAFAGSVLTAGKSAAEARAVVH